MTVSAAERARVGEMAPSGSPLLVIEGLGIGFQTERGAIRVVEEVSLEIAAGRCLALVGESGSGKSVTAQSILRLLPSPPAFVDTGHIRFEGRDLLTLPERELRRIRGERIGMIFQEPMTSLNPTFTIGDQIAEVLELHRRVPRREALEAAAAMLTRVGIGEARRRLDQYPHQLSGGLRQRVMIAMALVLSPSLLIADEPTTALDVTIQAQILALLAELRHELGLAILLITHDLGVVAELAEEVAVLYAGRIVETGSAAAVLTRPRHPYTAGLIASSPRRAVKGARLPAIPGAVPGPSERGQGCTFAARCVRAEARCRTERPALGPAEGEPKRALACWSPLP